MNSVKQTKTTKTSQQQPHEPKAMEQIPPIASTPVLADGSVVKLRDFSHAELLSVAQRHNRHLGLADDVLEPVMRTVADASTARPPAVHPFTAGGAPRKDEHQAAWKALAKRVGVPLMVFSEAQNTATAARPGHARGNLQSSAPAVNSSAAVSALLETAALPTHSQMYGSSDQPLQQIQFVEILTAWLGLGPIDLPLLAPGAPPLQLRRLFLEVRCFYWQMEVGYTDQIRPIRAFPFTAHQHTGFAPLT